jgi:hypothetical protein
MIARTGFPSAFVQECVNILPLVAISLLDAKRQSDGLASRWLQNDASAHSIVENARYWRMT